MDGMLSLLDLSVVALKQDNRIGFIPPKYQKSDEFKELNNKVRRWSEEDKYDKVEMFEKIVEYIDDNNIPLVVIKGKGERIKVNKYNMEE